MATLPCAKIHGQQGIQAMTAGGSILDSISYLGALAGNLLGNGLERTLVLLCAL